MLRWAEGLYVSSQLTGSACSCPIEAGCPLAFLAGNYSGFLQIETCDVLNMKARSVCAHLAQVCSCTVHDAALMSVRSCKHFEPSMHPPLQADLWPHHQSTTAPEERWVLPKLDGSVVPHVHQVAQLGAPVLQVGRVDHACMCRGAVGLLAMAAGEHIREDWARPAQLEAPVQLTGIPREPCMSRANGVPALTHGSMGVLADGRNRLGRDTCTAGTEALRVGHIHQT